MSFSSLSNLLMILPTIPPKKQTKKQIKPINFYKRKSSKKNNMVYTSIPAYIDQANWQQQQPNHQQDITGATSGSQLLHPPPPPLPSWTQPHGTGGTGSTGSIRPGSMVDKARMANIPMQEPAQRCPRCDSTNTKFCYFNNYSLSQPRHFCKTCRRYWTRGGAMRNVPVGGGCRRNKRSKGTNTTSSSKSPASSDRQTASSAGGPTNSASSAEMVGLGPMVPPSLSFMAPLHHQLGDHQLSSVGGGDQIGLNYYGMRYNAISGPMGGIIGDLNSHIGSGSNAGNFEQWTVPQTHQFPFLANLEPSSSSHGGLLPLESTINEAPGYGGSGCVRPKMSASGAISQLASVKMKEENNNTEELNLSRQFLGMSNFSSDHQQYLSTGTTTSAWTDLAGFSSSSTATNNQQ